MVQGFVAKALANQSGGLAPNRILRSIVEGPEWLKEYTFIVLGRTGPTGKTWVCTGLKEYGFRAIELSEGINGIVNYEDDKNYVIENDIDKTITIILNKHLPK